MKKDIVQRFISIFLSALLMTSLLCIFSVSATEEKIYYLFGYINGANYACEDDYQNMGEYRFENGQVTVCFSKDSYVAVKEEGNANWYMTNGWQGKDTTSVILYNTNELGGYADKMFVPKDTEISFVLCDNGDGTLNLSYIKPQETTSESSASSTSNSTQEIKIRDELNMLVASYSFGVDERIYTPDSYSVYKEAYENANRLLVDNNSTDEQLKKAYTDLIDAKNSLVRLADTISTETTATEVEETVTSEKPESSIATDVTESTVETSENVQSTSLFVTEPAETTTNPTCNISAREKLSMLVAEYSFGVDESIYTPDSYSLYKEAYENANKLLVDHNSTDEQLEKAYTDLFDAKNSLVRLTDTTSMATSETTEPSSSETITNPSETIESTSSNPSITTEATEKTEPTETTVPATEITKTTEPTETTEPTTETTEPTTETTEPTTEATKPTEPVTTPTEGTEPTEPVEKKVNPVKVTVKNTSVSAKKLVSKKQAVKPITVKDAKGEVEVVKVKSGTTSKIYKKITVNKKTGAITFSKGKYSKKTYSIKLKITAKGNSEYKSKVITKTVKVKVK